MNIKDQSSFLNSGNNVTNSGRNKKRLFYNNFNSNVPNKRSNNKEFERSGKWTPEEESFANRLIIDFEAGRLRDCDDGCTLRSYLAKRLRCAPMRISKKFTGRCIGKLVFTRQNYDDSHQVHNIDELEHYFERSCREDSDVSSMTDSIGYNSNPIDSQTIDNESPRMNYCTKKMSLKKSKRISKYSQLNPKHTNEIKTFDWNEIDICCDMSRSASCSSSDSSTSNQSNEFELFDTSIESYDNSQDEEADEWLNVLSFFCSSADTECQPSDLPILKYENDNLSTLSPLKHNLSNLSFILI